MATEPIHTNTKGCVCKNWNNNKRIPTGIKSTILERMTFPAFKNDAFDNLIIAMQRYPYTKIPEMAKRASAMKTLPIRPPITRDTSRVMKLAILYVNPKSCFSRTTYNVLNGDEINQMKVQIPNIWAYIPASLQMVPNTTVKISPPIHVNIRRGNNPISTRTLNTFSTREPSVPSLFASAAL